MLWQYARGRPLCVIGLGGAFATAHVSTAHDDGAASQVVFSIEPAQLADLAPGASASFTVTGLCGSARSVEESLLCALITGKAQQTLFTVAARCIGLPVCDQEPCIGRWNALIALVHSLRVNLGTSHHIDHGSCRFSSPKTSYHCHFLVQRRGDIKLLNCTGRRSRSQRWLCPSAPSPLSTPGSQASSPPRWCSRWRLETSLRSRWKCACGRHRPLASARRQ